LAITTCITNQYKLDLLQGAAPVIVLSNTQPGNTFASSNQLMSGLTSTANLSVGMMITGANVNAANVTYIQRIINSTALEMSQGSAGVSVANNYTFQGDTLRMALIRFGSQAGTYDRNTVAYANIVTTSDEVVGTGYTANGVTLTVAQMPDVPDSNTAITNFSPNPSWTTATINTAGAMIYYIQASNSSFSGCRSGKTGANGTSFVNAVPGTNAAYHAIGLYDFGGEQKVTSGTLTVNMPTANGTAAVIRIA